MCAFPIVFFYFKTVTNDKTNLFLNQKHTGIVNTRLTTMSKAGITACATGQMEPQDKG